jgi:uncharacterized membrane protein YraQ (UPF0718 family)
MLLFIWTSTIICFAVSYRKDKSRTLKSATKSMASFKNLLPGLLSMIAIVGLVLAVIPENQFARLFAVEGIWGLVLVSLAGAIVTIPGPIAFPLAGALLKLGAAPAVLASFITTLTMVGVVSAPLEASFFGLRFTLLRQFFSFFSAIAIGLTLGVLL